MHFKSLLVPTGTVCTFLVLGSGFCRADAEDSLLKKFQTQNQTSAEKLKQAVSETLARANSPGKEDSAKLLDLLRKNLMQLQEDRQLTKAERAALIQKVQERLKDLKEEVAEKSKKDTTIVRLQPGTGSLGLPDIQAGPGQPTIIPRGPVGGPMGISPFSAFTVTPVVNAGATSVRVNISGTFTIPTMGPLIPIQIPVPSVFYGPGKKFTAGQQEKIFTIFLPFRNVESVGVNTTVNVPDGGTAVVGGFQNSAEARNEFGPPGLSQVPYLSRLFKNVGYGRQTSSSRIGVSVRIISLEEEEQKLFGK
jgi:hypothetical protein